MLILDDVSDVIVAAATASGKTEAAFLPICSRLGTGAPAAGVSVLYISPLKALINDQSSRLDELCERVGVSVHRWHGDVSSSAKAKLLRQPTGVLLITPESLEALLARRGTIVQTIFAGLQYVVIDEMHAFIGQARGNQLQSLLHRIELAIRRRVPRIGLSATLSDFNAARHFLRPDKPERVEVVSPDDDGQELRFQLLAFTSPGKEVASKTDDEPSELRSIAQHLLDRLHGSHNLVFANSRQKVEALADTLNRLSVEKHLTNEFLPHHGNLSKDVREDVEARLSDKSRATTAVCTSTLELGIDIGSMESVAQVGAPPSVASLRQRLGRAGRRGTPAVLRVYASEPELDQRTPPVDALRPELVKSIATVNLLLEKWYEPPLLGIFDYSTLIQQVMSLIAQHGGVSAADAYRVLCGPGPFEKVDSTRFATLLRDMGKADPVVQMEDGLLIHGVVGERIVNHYEFYTAFVTPDEYRLIANGRTIGTLPVDFPLYEGALIVFAGKRWQVLSIDSQQKVIELSRASGGRPPDFGGSGMLADCRVHQEMLSIYGSDTIPAYLDDRGRRFLSEGRDNFARFGLDARSLMAHGDDSLAFHWNGERVGMTLVIALAERGVKATGEGVAITATDTSITDLRTHLQELSASVTPSAVSLAGPVEVKREAKYDWVLDESLLSEAYASRNLDVPATWRCLGALATDSVPRWSD